MSYTATDPRFSRARTAPRRKLRVSWSDPAFRAIVWQAVIVAIVGLIAWYLIGNTNPVSSVNYYDASSVGIQPVTAGNHLAERVVASPSVVPRRAG